MKLAKRAWASIKVLWAKIIHHKRTKMRQWTYHGPWTGLLQTHAWASMTCWEELNQYCKTKRARYRTLNKWKLLQAKVNGINEDPTGRSRRKQTSKQSSIIIQHQSKRLKCKITKAQWRTLRAMEWMGIVEDSTGDTRRDEHHSRHWLTSITKPNHQSHAGHQMIFNKEIRQAATLAHCKTPRAR